MDPVPGSRSPAKGLHPDHVRLAINGTIGPGQRRSAPLSGLRHGSSCRWEQFPVFPVEPGISPILPAQRPFGRENGKANQTLASEFP
jgi:hypothetical protein